MFKVQRAGSSIILHRRFVHPCFPVAEAGPAVVVVKEIEPCSVAFWRAADLLDGGASIFKSHLGWLGIQPGTKQSVRILAPWEPTGGFWKSFEASLGIAPLWHKWHGGKLPDNDVDVSIVFLPRAIFPKLTLAQIAERLADQILGGAAIYDAWELADLADRLKAKAASKGE